MTSKGSQKGKGLRCHHDVNVLEPTRFLVQEFKDELGFPFSEKRFKDRSPQLVFPVKDVEQQQVVIPELVLFLKG